MSVLIILVRRHSGNEENGDMDRPQVVNKLLLYPWHGVHATS